MTTTPPTRPDPADDAVRRRRRRRPEADDATSATDAAPSASPPKAVPTRRPTSVEGWRNLLPRAWGLSPTFRVFLFLGGVLGVMGFLLYNEYVIQTFREQERGRAELYAELHGLALSEATPPELAGDIFGKVILDQSFDFTMIVTDHRGRIRYWRGSGLPAPVAEPEVPSPQALAVVREVMREMDAVNEPVPAAWSTEALIDLYHDGDRVVLVDSEGYPVAWSGTGLPAARDTTVEAQVLAAIDGLAEAASFHLSTETSHQLVRDGADFVVADQGAVVAWGGPSLPPFAEGVAPPPPAQALYDRIAAAQEPFVFRVHNELMVHFGDTELISRISMAPFLTIGVLLLFVLIGWVGSRNIRRSEQRSIWVGMAKETAHQLGTPLSSLSGWLELMEMRVRDLAATPGESAADVEALQQAIAEMQRDMGRLTQIASRFSQIGSVPELKHTDINGVIRDTVAWFEGRGSQFGRHRFEVELQTVPTVPLNTELMGWAFENLCKNSIDAMVQQEGCIRISTSYDEERRCVRILVDDDGRGIDAENLARVFQPGFSTKKRGWGLGLAFVRRIVEEYHGGQIHIPRSTPGEGTTFEINLPA
jgi:signal transduction histidine kinase